jgi:hypothetical protein
MLLTYQQEQAREESGIQVARYPVLQEGAAQEFDDLQDDIVRVYEDHGIDIVLETHPQVNLSRQPIPMSWLRHALGVRTIGNAVKELQYRYQELGSTALGPLRNIQASRPYSISIRFEGVRCIEMGWQFDDHILRVEQAQLDAILPGVPADKFGLNLSAHMPIATVPADTPRPINALTWDFLTYAAGRLPVDLEPYFNVQPEQASAQRMVQ